MAGVLDQVLGSINPVKIIFSMGYLKKNLDLLSGVLFRSMISR